MLNYYSEIIIIITYGLSSPLVCAESDSSVAVLNCAAYPELCQLYSITHYPTTTVFRASPNDWVLFQPAVLNSRSMLEAVCLKCPQQNVEGLVHVCICMCVCVCVCVM